jgi:hypothetical protein
LKLPGLAGLGDVEEMVLSASCENEPSSTKITDKKYLLKFGVLGLELLF